MSADYCGVIEHDDDCLCDVIVLNHTPWIGDAIQDMWMGQEIVNLMGYTVEWDDETILKYLSDLVFAKDNWEGPNFRVTTTPSNKYGTLRSEIRKRLHETDDSIFDVARELGLSYGELLFTLFTGRRNMPPEKLRMFEHDVKTRAFANANGFAIKYDMPYRSASQLHSYWGVPYGEKQDSRSEVDTVMDELIFGDPSKTNREIVQDVYSRTGTMIEINKVRSRRNYLRSRGRL